MTNDNQNPSDGAVGMSRRENIPNDGVTEPERELESVTETLESVKSGDRVKVGIAIDHPEDGRTGGTSEMKCIRVETNGHDFDRRVSLLHHDGDVFRIYMTGTGKDGMDPWEIVSCPYDPKIGLADMTDLAFHGWIVEAEIIES